MKNRHAYHWAMGITLAATFGLIWLSLGVGIIGGDGDPANRMYLGVAAIGIIGSLAVRLRSRGMVWVLAVMSLATVMVGGYAVIRGLGLPWSGPLELILLNGFFILMFISAAWLFHRSR